MYIPNVNTQNYPFYRLQFVIVWNISTLNLKNQAIKIH